MCVCMWRCHHWLSSTSLFETGSQWICRLLVWLDWPAGQTPEMSPSQLPWDGVCWCPSLWIFVWQLVPSASWKLSEQVYIDNRSSWISWFLGNSYVTVPSLFWFRLGPGLPISCTERWASIFLLMPLVGRGALWTWQMATYGYVARDTCSVKYDNVWNQVYHRGNEHGPRKIWWSWTQHKGWVRDTE